MDRYNDTLSKGDQIGCYQIEQLIGRGGFAVTYLARDLHLDVDVAVKEYLPRDIVRRDVNLNVVPAAEEYIEDYDNGLSSFAREAKTLARFKHPNIVRVHQVLHKYHTAYMVMDYERGQEMAELLDNYGTIAENDLVAITEPVLAGLEEIHRHGFVHRDIKPSNIYLRDNGYPVLLDFGAARFAMSEATQQLTAVVTVGYTPIEQYNISDEDQGPWSDIYALAAVLYEAVSGEMPVDSITRATAMQVKHDADPLVSIHRLAAADYSHEFLDAIDWGLQFNAEQRPRSIEQWREAMLPHPAPTSRAGPVLKPAPVPPRQPAIAVVPRRDSFNQSLLDTRSALDSAEVETVLLDPGDTVLLEKSPEPASTRADRRVERQQSHNQTRLNPTTPTIPSTDNTASSTPPAAPLHRPAAQRSHTQEVRDLVKRDIMGRKGQTPAAAKPAPLIDATNDLTADDFEDIPERAETPAGRLAGGRAQIAHHERAIGPPDNDPFDDDEDWDYPRPSRLAGLRWIFPAVALVSIVGASLYYVNKPVRYPATVSNPQSTAVDIDAALATAQALESTGSGVFPIGDSALDLYQQVLQQSPDNTAALAGLARIEGIVTKSIIDSVESNQLAYANRLMVRANNANLQVEGIPPQNGVAEPSTEAPASPQPAADFDRVNNTISEIQTLLSTNRTDEAQALLDNNARYFSDLAVLEQLRALIDAQRSNSFVEAPPQPEAISADNAIVGAPQPIADGPDVNEQSVVVASSPPPAPVNLEPAAEAAESAPPPPPPSGSTRVRGALGQHLDKLRVALASKNIDAVLAQGALSADREQFLRRMFTRYDHLSVSIGQVQTSANTATAKLNITMYNQRADGSYYSAGRWNGVTLNTRRSDAGWQAVRW